MELSKVVSQNGLIHIQNPFSFFSKLRSPPPLPMSPRMSYDKVLLTFSYVIMDGSVDLFSVPFIFFFLWI